MRRVKLILCFSLILIITGCVKVEDKSNNYKENETTYVENNEDEDLLYNKIKDMSIEEKIGQMIISGFEGYEYNEGLDRLLNEYKVGGVILFARNIRDSSQMSNLTELLQASNKSIPIFISIDEEGGRVSRLPEEAEKFPSAFTIGQINDEQTAYENGKEIGDVLKNLGINLDYAPVLDIYSNDRNTVIGDRAFGTEESIVSKMGIATMKGIEESNVVPVVKHFPGHGDTEVDSHYGLPIVYKSLEELQNFEFVPFKNAIDNECDVIMVGHIILNKIDNENPASLSKVIIQDILRSTLGFKKVIVTDDMSMGAITNTMSIEEACIKSIKAGCDILLLGNAYDEIEDVINSIKLEVESGNIDEKDIEESVSRILELKKKYGIMEGKNEY